MVRKHHMEAESPIWTHEATKEGNLEVTTSSLESLEQRYRPEVLVTFARELLISSGMPDDKARDVAEIVVEGELLGKHTHGFSLLPRYVREIESGGMAVEGSPIVINDYGACLAWDGRKLPGPWLVRRALDAAIARAKEFGMGAVTIQRSHHLACLGTYLSRATDQGYLMLLTLTDPAHSSVAPYGGVTPVLTSNPIAFGAPTGNIPILIDTTTSLQSNGMVALYRERGESLPNPDLMDNQGQPTYDPNVIVTNPGGSILPIGGINSGHKGAAISILVELLTGCLSGWGRAEPDQGWSAAAFLLILDPAVFGGRAAYLRQVETLVQLCRNSVPRPGFDKVRLPGEGGLERRARQTNAGIPLPASLIKELNAQARQYEISMPKPL